MLAYMLNGAHVVTTMVTNGSAPQVTWTMLVNFVVGILLPIVVALVTKMATHPRVKAVLLLVLSGVAGVLNEWLVSTGSFNWPKALYDTVTVFVIGVATLYGLWKPTQVSAAAQRSLVK